MDVDPIDALCAAVGDETRACESLAEVLRGEREAVVALRPEAILARLGERRLLGGELARLAARRRGLVADVAAGCGLIAGSASALLPHLPAVPRSRLADGLRALRTALVVVRGLERQNARLAAASVATTDEVLRAVAAVVPGARYGADARLDPPPARERIDRRA